MIYTSGGFLLEAGWYQDAKKILDTSYKLCNTREPEDCKIAAKLLTRYKKLHLSQYVWHRVLQTVIQESQRTVK